MGSFSLLATHHGLLEKCKQSCCLIKQLIHISMLQVINSTHISLSLDYFDLLSGKPEANNNMGHLISIDRGVNRARSG